VSIAAFGNAGWAFTIVTILLSQVGVASSYVDLTRTTLVHFVPGLAPVWADVALWGGLSLICMVVNPGMREVAWFSAVALAVYAYIYALLAFYAGQPPYRSAPIKAWDASGLSVWYGPALFSFEGMGTAVAIYESMGRIEPDRYMRVATVAYAVGGVVYTYVMTTGYLAYGPSVPHNLLDAFPETAVGRSAQWVVVVALTCSYVLQMTPVFQMVETSIPGWAARFWPLWRTLLVGGTILLTVLVPAMEQMVGITGALSFSLLCFVLPGAFYLKLHPDDSGWYAKVVALALIPVGLLGAVFGTIGAVGDGIVVVNTHAY